MNSMLLLTLPQTMAANLPGYVAAGSLGLAVCVVLLVQIFRCGRR